MNLFSTIIDSFTRLTQAMLTLLILVATISGHQLPSSFPTPSFQPQSVKPSLPSPSSSISPQQPTAYPSPAGPNYQLEPDPQGREGFYVMKSKPEEHMSSVDELNQAVNQYRATHNLSQLYIDPQLCDIALQRATEIEENFSHDQFATHVENGDYTYTGFNSIGENLWQGKFSGVHIVEYGWDQSPGHRSNLQGDWTRGCAGIYLENAVFTFAR